MTHHGQKNKTGSEISRVSCQEIYLVLNSYPAKFDVLWKRLEDLTKGNSEKSQ